MQQNEEIIERFYSAFQKLDYVGMNCCYSEDIVFNDPVFGLLRGEEAMYMWEMLCTNAKEFSLSFSNIQLLDDEYATCDWVAQYTFSKTGRKIVNRIRAYMRLKEGKIIEHSDAFKISKWAAQAFGVKGFLLGQTGFMKRAIQKNARKNLVRFIEMKNANQG